MKVSEYYELIFNEILAALRRSTGLFLVMDHASFGTGRARLLFEGKPMLWLVVVPGGAFGEALKVPQTWNDVTGLKPEGFVESALILPNGRISAITSAWDLALPEMRDNLRAVEQTTRDIDMVLGLHIKT